MRILIVGTAGRDFHVFNTHYRSAPDHQVVAFTSAELAPDEVGRYPGCLSGPLYPDGVPILPESQLHTIVLDLEVQQVVFAYSEIACAAVGTIAAQVLAAGADFKVVNPRSSMLVSTKPVIAVTSAWAGAGKSPTVRYLAELLSSWELRVGIVQHPMRIQRFQQDRTHIEVEMDGIVRDACAAPTKEQFEAVPGAAAFSGLDFAAILQAAEADSDVILWDGAGSDLPFLEPSLHLVLTDPLRSEGPAAVYPGEAGLRMADVVIISKCDAADALQIAAVRHAVLQLNPAAKVLTADSPVVVTDGEQLRGCTVVVVEEELALSLGALRPGAGIEAARLVGSSGIISPMPQAVGSLVEVYARHPEAHSILPAMGYSAAELADLKATLDATPSEGVIDATRVDLASLLRLSRPVAQASYALVPHDSALLTELIRAAVQPGL